MKKINCKIISVDPGNAEDFKAVQHFGHAVEDKVKMRYITRRKNVEKFINSFKSNKFNIEIFNAVTPNKFKLEKNSVFFEGKSFTVIEKAAEADFFIANILSHYKIWQTKEDTLIFEDDIIFNNESFIELYDLINNFSSQQLTDTILYLQLSCPSDVNASNKYLICGNLINEQIGYAANNNDFSGTGAYFISKECKEILLNNMQGLRACDAYLNTLRELNAIKYCIPTNSNKMFCLDVNTFWL